MPTLSAKQYREERAPVVKQIQDLAALVNEEQREFTAEEQDKWTTLNTECDRLKSCIDRAERSETLAYEMETPIEEQRERQRMPGRDDVNHRASTRDWRGECDEEERQEDPAVIERRYNLALQGWARAQYNIPLEKRHADACTAFGIRPQQEELQIKLRSDYGNVRREHRALSSLTDTSGAYLVPQGFVNNIEMALLDFGGMRSVADVMRTDTGNDLPWPMSDDTSNEGALIGESVAVSEQDISVGQTVFHAYMYSSKMVRVPRQLFDDSAFDIASMLGPILGTRIARRTNRDFTTGDGAAKPKGIVTAATAGVTASSQTAFTADEIISLVHSVDPSYRNGAGFMLHDNVLMAVRKLKDGNGQYLWQPGMQAGVPDRIYGYPLTINQHMSSTVESGAKTILFGALGKYKIRDVQGFTLLRLRERYADQYQEGFLAFTRHDGNLLDAGTHPVKYLVQA